MELDGEDKAAVLDAYLERYRFTAWVSETQSLSYLSGERAWLCLVYRRETDQIA